MSRNVSYKLRQYKSSKDPDFLAALLLYVRNTPPTVRAESNEITYWVDNFRKTFLDDFYVFGFYRNRRLIGYAQAAYFRNEKMFALDYIAVDPAHRTNGAFNEFVDELREFMENEHPEYRYGLAEIICNNAEPDTESAEGHLMVRLFKQQGFRMIRAPYYQPRVMFEVPESELKADLLVYARNPLDEISTETYLRIVETLYFKHYFRWKNILPESQPEYREYLDKLYMRVTTAVTKNERIIVNGHKSVLKPATKKPVITVHRFISFAAQGLVLVTLLAGAMLGLKTAFGLSAISLIVIYAVALASFMGVVGVVSKDAREMFGDLLQLAKSVIDRRANDLPPTSPRALPISQSDQEKQ